MRMRQKERRTIRADKRKYTRSEDLGAAESADSAGLIGIGGGIVGDGNYVQQHGSIQTPLALFAPCKQCPVSQSPILSPSPLTSLPSPRLHCHPLESLASLLVALAAVRNHRHHPAITNGVRGLSYVASYFMYDPRQGRTTVLYDRSSRPTRSLTVPAGSVEFSAHQSYSAWMSRGAPSQSRCRDLADSCNAIQCYAWHTFAHRETGPHKRLRPAQLECRWQVPWEVRHKRMGCRTAEHNSLIGGLRLRRKKLGRFLPHSKSEAHVDSLPHSVPRGKIPLPLSAPPTLRDDRSRVQKFTRIANSKVCIVNEDNLRAFSPFTPQPGSDWPKTVRSEFSLVTRKILSFHKVEEPDFIDVSKDLNNTTLGLYSFRILIDCGCTAQKVAQIGGLDPGPRPLVTAGKANRKRLLASTISKVAAPAKRRRISTENDERRKCGYFCGDRDSQSESEGASLVHSFLHTECNGYKWDVGLEERQSFEQEKVKNQNLLGTSHLSCRGTIFRAVVENDKVGTGSV
ncbi:hypothetical protein DFH06DRAFT_1423889 [Mycena polygramma]|nr:hypothetical protein DFH06DRAFT_1423889 [Mycena polygramma]